MTNLDTLARLEQLAQRCTESIGNHLEAGMTEMAAASLMRQWLRQQGVTDLPHRPLAWFGERTHLSTSTATRPVTSLRPAHFPTSKKLEFSQPFALYCSLRQDNLMAEAVYCDHFGTHPGYQQLLYRTDHLKTSLLHAINRRRTLGELTQLLQRLTCTQGVELCQNSVVGNWIRPYHAAPDMGQYQQGLLGKIAQLTGSQAPAHLPAVVLSQSQNLPLASGLWVIQPWLHSGHLGAGLRSLLYIPPHGSAVWLNSPYTAIKAA